MASLAHLNLSPPVWVYCSTFKNAADSHTISQYYILRDQEKKIQDQNKLNISHVINITQISQINNSAAVCYNFDFFSASLLIAVV